MRDQAKSKGQSEPRDAMQSSQTLAEPPDPSGPATLDAAGIPWLRALQQLMGFNTEHGSTGAYFAWGSRESRLSWGDLRTLASRVKRDVVFLEFTEPLTDSPPSIILVTHERKGVHLFEDCELWVLSSWKNVEVLTPKRRFRIDDDGRLKGRPNNLDEMRARRVDSTHARWRALATELGRQTRNRGKEIPREMFEPQDGASVPKPRQSPDAS